MNLLTTIKSTTPENPHATKRTITISNMAPFYQVNLMNICFSKLTVHDDES
jgi:hypothetical protein